MKKWLWSMLVVLVMMVAPGVEVRAEDYAKPESIPSGEVVGDSGYVWRSGDPETLVHIKTGEEYTLPIRVSVLHNIHAIGDGRFILEGWQEWMVWNPHTGSKTVFPIDAGSGLHAVVDINLAADTVLWTDDKKYVTTSLSGKILGSIQAESMYEAYGLLDDGNVLAFVDGQVTKRTVTGETIETLGSYTGQVRGASSIKGSNQWIVAKVGESDTLFIFDLVTKQWIEKEAPSVRNLIWNDGVYYFTIRKMYTTFYVSYNVATNEWREAPIDDVFVQKRGSWYVFSENRSAGYTPESFWKAPWQLQVSVPKTTTRYEVGHPYEVSGTTTLVDGTTLPIPATELTARLAYQDDPFVWEQGKLTLQTNESYDMIFKWSDFERRLDLWASKYVPLTLDPPTGVLGPISGKTAPNTPVFVSVTKNLYQSNSSDSLLNYQSATVQSDESGRYTWQPARWFTPGSRVTVKIGSGSGVYADPIELQTVKEIEDTSSNGISVLTKTVTSGVTLKTTPNATVDVLIRSGKYYEISNEQADEDGLISIKEFSTIPIDIGTKVYFKLKEAPASAFRLTTVDTRVEPPVFSWTRTPLMYDKSINITSSTNQAYRIYRNGTHVATTRVMPYTFDTPLKEGDVILVTRSSGDATYELTKTVQAFTPTLSVTDTLVTKTQATLSIKKTSTATVRFYVNDKLVSAKRLSTTRYTVPAKPGDRVRVKASVGSKSREVSLSLPKTSLSTLSINDEKSLWVGYMIPNSTVTLKNGSKVLATGKSSSTGRVTLRFTRQPVNATLSLTSQSGTFRHTQTVKVTTGPTPTLVTTIPSSASKTLKATSNVSYGTLTLTRGSTVLAKKTVTATSSTLSFAPQKKGTKLTLRLVTPQGRSVTKTIYVR
ncbi:hypothetical protein [Exiguobacterium sp. SL-9]|uniref:hypothetical protein n=1 Tax=Exiguobacterium sp. SL-9 TaxID=2510963 RepID=UPI00103FE283|nr:hypothetical protein [Exiguobacterium sp. SL-9]TCI20502.1 hypothetical protein EVJ34_13615 [Exiguobacterium sp. SL-9]